MDGLATSSVLAGKYVMLAEASGFKTGMESTACSVLRMVVAVAVVRLTVDFVALDNVVRSVRSDGILTFQPKQHDIWNLGLIS